MSGNHSAFFEVLKGISLSVRKGEVICIIGPSGSGKSTLIRCINALQPISAGTIRVEGIDVSDRSSTNSRCAAKLEWSSSSTTSFRTRRRFRM
jgi:ABC-type polar amino acid transport system ATPase subunit